MLQHARHSLDACLMSVAEDAAVQPSTQRALEQPGSIAVDFSQHPFARAHGHEHVRGVAIHALMFNPTH